MPRILFATTLAAAIAAALALSLSAETTAPDHTGHDMSALGTNPAVAAFAAASAKMHTDMDIEFTGDADVDFVRGMIPHHQGAIDMARIVLEHGDDPEVKKLAEAVIAAQEGEIAWMRDWLAKNAP